MSRLCRIVPVLVASCFILVFTPGCSRIAVKGSSVEMTILDKNGSAAIEFGKWILVFETIPSKSVPVGEKGYIYYPVPGVNPGWGSRKLGDLAIVQEHNSKENLIKVNDWQFTIRDAGATLVFSDCTYKARESSTTILIAKDGTTKEEPSK